MSQIQAGAQGFIRRNRDIAARIKRHLPQARINVFRAYEETVAEYMNARSGQTVVDAGSGAKCHFAQFRAPDSGTRIIGFDVSLEEMAGNTDVDEKIEGDAEETLPFPDSDVDMIVSRSVLEHLHHVDPFLAETHRILRPGGYTIHLFPSKHAPFSTLNRLLPRWASSLLLRGLVPGSKGVLGFPAFYDHCTEREMIAAFARRGLEVRETRLNYYQSDYFGFFIPFYLVSVAYEYVVYRLNRRQLAAHVLIVAQKPV